jgi:hypothetical protein
MVVNVPYFPRPPDEYSPRYMAEVTRAFSVYTTQMQNPGPISHLTTAASASAADGMILWDGTNKYPVVSVDGVWRPVGIYGAVPASAGATGTAGQLAVDANYIYVCTATNTWKRTAISTW